MKSTFLIALLGMSWLGAVLSEPLSSELCLRTVDAADVESDTTEDEQTLILTRSYRWLKGVTERRVDLPALLFVTRYLIPHNPGYAFGRFCYPSVVVVCHAAPLYQAL